MMKYPFHNPINATGGKTASTLHFLTKYLFFERRFKMFNLTDLVKETIDECISEDDVKEAICDYLANYDFKSVIDDVVESELDSMSDEINDRIARIVKEMII